jgi:hypothetical protein
MTSPTKRFRRGSFRRNSLMPRLALTIPGKMGFGPPAPTARRPPNLHRYCSYWLSALSSWHRADMPSQHALPPRRPARGGRGGCRGVSPNATWNATQFTRTREATSNRSSMQAPTIRPNAYSARASQLVTRSPFRSSSSSSVTRSSIVCPRTQNIVRTKLQGMSVRLLAS